MALKLTYMAVRARAEVPLMIMNYAGLDHLYVSLPDRASVAAAKTMRTAAGKRYLTFGKLPVLETPDGHVFAQSGSIVRYLAGLTNLVPKNPAEAAQVDSVFEFAQEMTTINPIVNVFTGEKLEAAKQAYFKQLPPRLDALADLLGTDEWFYGTLSYADFGVFQVLDNVLTVQETALAAHPTLLAHHDRVAALPKVSTYLSKRPAVRTFEPKSAAPKPEAAATAGAGAGAGAGAAQ